VKVLVTGAAGFLGSHLTDALLGRGDQVVGLDNFDDFYDPARKRRNLLGAGASSGFTLIEGDIRDGRLVRESLDGVDGVVHLAARAGVRPSIADPRLYASVNVEGSLSLLEACREAGVRNLVVASSSSVYGGLTDLPFREDQRVDRPVSPYAATKAACELIASSYAHLHGFQIFSLRYFTVYGPRQRPEMAIHKFVRRLTEGRPIPLFGDGTSARDYTYVDDAVAATLSALDRVAEGGPCHRIYNVGESRTVQLRELIGMLGDLLGVEPVIESLPDQPGDVYATWAEVGKAGRELGYEPSTPIEEGLRRFVDWYREDRAEGAS
jgi:UDP-glucuronate 4-epimerase